MLKKLSPLSFMSSNDLAFTNSPRFKWHRIEKSYAAVLVLIRIVRSAFGFLGTYTSRSCSSVASHGA